MEYETIEKLANVRLRGDKHAWMASEHCANEGAAKFLYGRAWQGATLVFDGEEVAVFDSTLIQSIPGRQFQAFLSGVEGALLTVRLDQLDSIRLKPTLGTDTIIIDLPPGEAHIRCTKAGEVLNRILEARDA